MQEIYKNNEAAIEDRHKVFRRENNLMFGKL